MAHILLFSTEQKLSSERVVNVKKIEGIDYYTKDKIYFIRNKDGVLEAYKNGKKQGEMSTMGDSVKEKKPKK